MAWGLVSQRFRQISSALMVLNDVSTAALKLLYSSSGDLSYFWDAKLAVDFANDVAFQATNDFAFALSVFCTFLIISQSWFVASHPDCGHAIMGGVGLSISAWVQSEAVCFAAGGRDWANTTELYKFCLSTDARWIFANNYQHFRYGQYRYAMRCHQVWRAFGDKAFELLVVCNNLFMKPQPATHQCKHGCFCRGQWRVNIAWSEGRDTPD